MDYSAKEDIIEYFFEKIKYLIFPSEKNNYRSRFLESKILLYSVVLLLALKIITIFVSINIPQNIFFADITKIALENFANQTRQSLGLAPLVENSKLNEAAQLKAENMVAGDYFAHTSPTGITPWYWFLQAGYNYKYAGENLAVGFFDSEEVYNAWLNSPSHKANILNPNYKEIGTAVLGGFGQSNTVVVVQEFGSQLPTKIAVPVSNNSKQVVVQPKIPTVNLGPSPAVGTNQPISAVSSNTSTSTNANTNTNEKVLSQTTESQNVLEAGKTGSSNLYSKIMNSVLYDHNNWLQDIIYGISLIVVSTLLALIFVNLNFNFRKELVIRSIIVVILLSLTTLINREFIISIIPHQMMI